MWCCHFHTMTVMPIMQGYYHIAILGDMNTMAHGIARLSPNFCCDKMRFRNLGRTEAQFWEDAVLAQADKKYSAKFDGKAEQDNAREEMPLTELAQT